MIVARELSRQTTRLLIAAQPTRGVDVGSTEFIHARVIKERDAGSAVLLVSSELDEVLALADRIAVMYRGRILATLPADAPRERIGLLMAGITEGAGETGPGGTSPGEVSEPAGGTSPDAGISPHAGTSPGAGISPEPGTSPEAGKEEPS